MLLYFDPPPPTPDEHLLPVMVSCPASAIAARHQPLLRWQSSDHVDLSQGTPSAMGRAGRPQRPLAVKHTAWWLREMHKSALTAHLRLPCCWWCYRCCCCLHVLTCIAVICACSGADYDTGGVGSRTSQLLAGAQQQTPVQQQCR